MRDHNDECGRIERALRAVAKSLATIRPDLRGDDLAALLKFEGAVRDAQSQQWAQGRPQERWHAFAGPLAVAFETAMHSSNPRFQINWFHANGPAPRFFQAIIPCICHGSPAPVAVARYMQRRAGGE